MNLKNFSIIVIVCITIISFNVGASPSVQEFRASPQTRVTVSGTLLFDGDDYSLRLAAPIVCVSEFGRERMTSIGIGAGSGAYRNNRDMRRFQNQRVTVTAILDSPRGSCVLTGVQIALSER
jgi:hypothetical protein